jgi:hypothetical protein
MSVQPEFLITCSFKYAAGYYYHSYIYFLAAQKFEFVARRIKDLHGRHIINFWLRDYI